MSSNYEYISCADTAKLVRAALKHTFTTTQFSVRSKTYSGGASITVEWTDGPTSGEVERVTGQFNGADFDGTIDLKIGNSSWLMPDGTAMLARSYGTVGSLGIIPAQATGKPDPAARLVRFAADFIFATRHYTAAFLEPIAQQIGSLYGMPASRIAVDAFGAHAVTDYTQLAGGQQGRPIADEVWRRAEKTSGIPGGETPEEYPVVYVLDAATIVAAATIDTRPVFSAEPDEADYIPVGW
jgi:hypothetical protein